MDNEELLQHLFELSYALDNYSAGKDYAALRKTHYDNIKWLNDHGLTEDYYKVLFAHTQADKGDLK